MNSHGPVTGAQSLLRVLSILKYVAAAPVRGVALSEVTRDLGLTAPTAHRMLSVLLREGFLELNPRLKTYYLGREAYLLGVAAEHQYGGIKTIASPVLRELAQSTEDTCFLSIRSQYESLCIDRQSGSFPIKIPTLDVGHRRPLGVGSGSLALLAFLPVAERERVLAQYGSSSATMPFETVYADIASTQKRGYAVNPGRLHPDWIGVAVPVFDRERRVLASLSVAAIRPRLSGARLQEVVATLRQAAGALSAALTTP